MSIISTGSHLTTLVTRASSQTSLRNKVGADDVVGTGITVGAEDVGMEEQEIVLDDAVIHKITENPAFIALPLITYFHGIHIMQSFGLHQHVRACVTHMNRFL